MLILGHAGITLGAAVIAGGIKKHIHQRGAGSDAPASTPPQRKVGSWLSYLGTHLDIRLLLIGSLLPDLIDKPVGHFFFRETFNNGRIFSHTFLFLIVITIAGLLVYKWRRRNGVLALALGTFAHLVLDQMWRTPQTLWWPVLGFTFPTADISNWVGNIFLALISAPSVYVPELLGLAVIVWFAWLLFRRRTVSQFIKRGQIG